MQPTQTTAPSMCSAKASAAMSGLPVRGTIKRYYSGYTLAYASYGKEGLSSVRASSSQWLLMALSAVRCGANNSVAIGAKRTCRERQGVVDLTSLTRSGHEAPLFVAMHATDTP